MRKLEYPTQSAQLKFPVQGYDATDFTDKNGFVRITWLPR